MGWFVRYYCDEAPGYAAVDWCSTTDEAEAMTAELKKKNPGREYFYEYAEEE